MTPHDEKHVPVELARILRNRQGESAAQAEARCFQSSGTLP
jgi:hypothetical protein